MITILFNDEKLNIEMNMLLNELLIKQGYVDQGFAVSINRRFIANSQYKHTFLQEGDVVEIIRPMQGG